MQQLSEGARCEPVRGTICDLPFADPRMDSELVRMEDGVLRRSMNLSVAEGALATVMGTLAGGVFLTGFALEMGASGFQIGVLSALPVFANLAQLAGAFIIERRGECKQLCVATSVISRLLWLPIVLLPLCFAQNQSLA